MASPRNPFRLRVLIVDDDEERCKLLGGALRQAGHTVRAASDPETAMEAVAEFDPEVTVIGNARSPTIGDLVQEVRIWNAGCRLIGLSGQRETAPGRAVIEGFDEYLVEPMSVPSFLHAVAGNE